MHPLLRAAPLVALGLKATALVYAQPAAELPPLFAPRLPATSRLQPDARPRAGAPALISDRSRALVQAAAAHVLENAAVFDAGTASPNSITETSGGALVMAPVVVKGEALTDPQVRRPVVRLMHFVPESGDKYRRIAGGATATLYHAFVGDKELQVDFSIFNLAGRGVDHQTDFTRAEIAFRFKW